MAHYCSRHASFVDASDVLDGYIHVAPPPPGIEVATHGHTLHGAEASFEAVRTASGWRRVGPAEAEVEDESILVADLAPPPDED